ncbi:zinc finger protein 76 isoform X1 [Phasianus colchicus]|uniref:zinc finger protein 76 isoform X1 n=1 Tax=Phasianus colchicus TaxID=9054 RepID=UPI00129D2D96|nr:zinc finger protein 76 isoform X1 [Phasianus colchicus]
MESLQAVTLSDGTAASEQRAAKDEKVIEEQVTETEDENTVYIHPVIVEKDFVAFEDGQPVVSEDRGMAYIPKEGFDSRTSEAVQPEDDSTTNSHSPAIVLPDIMEVQAETEQEEKDAAFDVRTINALKQYANKHLQEQEVHSNEKRIRAAHRAHRCGYTGCGRIYTTAQHLKVHERSHTGDRPYACRFPSCGKTFATAYGQKTHMKIHTSEKPFKCPEDSCSKAFRASGDLQKHIRTHTGVRPFKCPFEYCDRSFTTSHILRVHIRTHTGERPYTCPEPMCGRSFTSVTNYKNHIRIHTGEKPYACPVPGCGKCFTEYSSLYKHQVVHTRSRPYSCKICGKAYSQKSTLGTHKCSGRRELEATEESEEVQQQLEVAAEGGSPMKRQHVAFPSEMEKDKDEEEYDDMPTQVSLISQDETEQISLSQEDLQALGSAVSMVIQNSALSVPEEEFVCGDMHTMAVINADGTETQPVTIVTSGAVMSEESAITSLYHQQVALLATTNGAHIALQLEKQQSLENTISMMAAATQHEPVTLDTAMAENGC